MIYMCGTSKFVRKQILLSCIYNLVILKVAVEHRYTNLGSNSFEVKNVNDWIHTYLDTLVVIVPRLVFIL